MIQYFPKPYEPFVGDIDVKVDFSNYVTKADLKNATGVDISSFAKKTDLASLKSNATKTTLNPKLNEGKGEIPSNTNLATATALTAVESKIPNVTNLVKKN